MSAAEWIARQRHLSNCARASRLALDALEAAIDAGRAHREHGLCACLGCEMYKRIESVLSAKP